MKEVLVIGTIHLNWTPKDELEEALRNLRPDKLHVELSPEELNKPREDSIRDEMFVAYDWAARNNIPVSVFDIDEDILKDGVTGKESEFMAHELKEKELLKNYTWKDLNSAKPWQEPVIAALEKEIVKKYFNKEKSELREHKMLKNVKDGLIEGRNVIVTGAGHLNFFEREIPSAELPFRT